MLELRALERRKLGQEKDSEKTLQRNYRNYDDYELLSCISFGPLARNGCPRGIRPMPPMRHTCKN